MRTKDYIQATYEVLRTRPDTHAVLDSLRAHLTAKGRMALYPSILRGLIKKVAYAEEHAKVRVITARDTDFETLRESITHHLTALDVSIADTVRIVDDTLIGGFVINMTHARIDRSYKHILLQAYRRLID